MPSQISHSSNRFFLGIDGGGSTTRAIIANESGSHWGYGEASGSNPHDRGIAGSVEQLIAATSQAWQQVGIPAHPFSGAFLGVAGAGTLNDTAKRELTLWINVSSEAAVEVDHDIRIALAGGLSGRPGIAVVAGTGSSGYGRTADGRTARSGGWGALIDDAGGGYWLGLRALAAVARSHDGRGAATALTSTVLDLTGSQSERQILDWLRRPGVGRPEIAALAKAVFESAAGGDPTAQALLADGARELALIAHAVAEKLFSKQKAEVVVTGGLSQLLEYRNAFSRELTSAAPLLRVTAAEHIPLVGALMLASVNRGVFPSPQWVETADEVAKPRRTSSAG